VNDFLKPEVISSATVGMLERELTLGRLIWSNPGLDFAGAKNDTVSIRIPARTAAREFAWRGTTAARGDIVLDDLAEDSISVTLNRDIYNAVPVTDEELTLDIENFGARVLDPQVRAIATYLDTEVANLIEDEANYTEDNTVTWDPENTYASVLAARKVLNLNHVPAGGRYLLVGSDVEEQLLLDNRLLSVAESGSDGALRDAMVGRLAGFTVVTSTVIDPASAYAFVPSAFIMVTRTPVIPAGAAWGSAASHAGYAMRWIRDYDASKLRDRSVVNTFMGTKAVFDQPTPGDVEGDKVMKRAVKLTPDADPEG